MSILLADTVEELKQNGSLKEVRAQVQATLGDRFTVKARSWQNLLEAVRAIRQLARSLAPSPDVDLDPYFKSTADRLIFILTQTDGSQRCKNLNISRLHYLRPELAKEWHRRIAKIIHPDVCDRPNAAQAFAEFQEIYENMIGR